MDGSGLKKDQIYLAKVVGCETLQKIRIMNVMTNCATVELIEGGKNGVVKLTDIFPMEQKS
ncbi:MULTISPECIES: hypothetical protein [Enterococcus]|uniref:hypothetical protein n=1 Tax=Enterococcus TaxID=1350 RepID=UPI00065E71A9|nr:MULTISPECIES: hypothetical protein [Enterococcus]KAF1300094.1 hypothetical protein BAU16_12675 [Enterococcus sp. JM9B]